MKLKQIWINGIIYDVMNEEKNNQPIEDGEPIFLEIDNHGRHYLEDLNPLESYPLLLKYGNNEYWSSLGTFDYELKNDKSMEIKLYLSPIPNSRRTREWLYLGNIEEDNQ